MIAPTHKLTGSQRRRAEKLALLAADPRCCACGRDVVLTPNLHNSAHLVRHFLACPDHVAAVRKAGKHGIDDAVIVMAAKGREFVEQARSTEFGIAYIEWRTERLKPQPTWLVDGVEFQSIEEAETRAVELARVLGAAIQIWERLGLHGPLKMVQVVRPGDDARFADESFHRGRRATIEFARR